MNFLKKLYKSGKKRFYVLSCVGVLVLVIVCAYMYGSHYLADIIQNDPQNEQVSNDTSVVGDNIILRYIKDTGTVVSYSADRTETEDNTNIIKAYFPRLEYAFPNKAKPSIFMDAGFGLLNQQNKIATFEQMVFLENGEIKVRSDIAHFYLDSDIVIFPEGATIEDTNIMKATELRWNVVTNTIEAKNVTIYIFSSKP